MRFVMLMPPGVNAERDERSNPETILAMTKGNEGQRSAGGRLCHALEGGIAADGQGGRVTFAGGTPAVTDGPFAEARAVVGGFWIIQVEAKAEAAAWASRCPAEADDIIGLRQVAELTDVPDDIMHLNR